MIMYDRRIYAGMTRVVWQLTEVLEEKGRTYFVPRSHKANYNIRNSSIPNLDKKDSGLWESYSCSPGSLVVFSEAVRHSADFWQNPNNPSMTIFCAYNHINVRHHKPSFAPEVVEGLCPQHQRFFNEVYHPQFECWEQQEQSLKYVNAANNLLGNKIDRGLKTKLKSIVKTFVN